MTQRKFIQVAVGGYNHTRLYALCDDGTLWQRHKDKWYWLGPAPQAAVNRGDDGIQVRQA